MRRDQLEHVIRAAADVTGEREFIIIGSQAILAQHPDAPEPLLVSREADLYPLHEPDLSLEIEGSLGRGSRFDQTFGYHADGVSPDTATLPAGWEDRLTGIRNANTNGAVGWCLETHDLAIAKYVAGREKDLRYTAELWKAGYIEPATLNRRLHETELEPKVRTVVAGRIRGDWRRHQQHPGRSIGD